MRVIAAGMLLELLDIYHFSVFARFLNIHVFECHI